MKSRAAIWPIVVAAGLTFLSACSMGKPMDIPVPKSQITPKAGLVSDDTGEWVIYRKQ
jgi:hypothetical protein